MAPSVHGTEPYFSDSEIVVNKRESRRRRIQRQGRGQERQSPSTPQNMRFDVSQRDRSGGEYGRKHVCFCTESQPTQAGHFDVNCECRPVWPNDPLTRSFERGRETGRGREKSRERERDFGERRDRSAVYNERLHHSAPGRQQRPRDDFSNSDLEHMSLISVPIDTSPESYKKTEYSSSEQFPTQSSPRRLQEYSSSEQFPTQSSPRRLSELSMSRQAMQGSGGGNMTTPTYDRGYLSSTESSGGLQQIGISRTTTTFSDSDTNKFVSIKADSTGKYLINTPQHTVEIERRPSREIERRPLRETERRPSREKRQPSPETERRPLRETERRPSREIERQPSRERSRFRDKSFKRDGYARANFSGDMYASELPEVGSEFHSERQSYPTQSSPRRLSELSMSRQAMQGSGGGNITQKDFFQGTELSASISSISETDQTMNNNNSNSTAESFSTGFATLDEKIANLQAKIDRTKAVFS